MSDEIKIVPDPAPIEPHDVAVVPDGPPAQPFDVTTLADRPPQAPFDVPVLPDIGPRVPIDVPIITDRPPGVPIDVQVVLDSPPIGPFQVPITPDGPPSVPIDVATVGDAAPAAPFQVPVTLSGPPAAAFDVATSPSPPPASPFQVPVFPDPPSVQVRGSSGAVPTLEQIISSVSTFDRTLGSFLSTLIDIDPITTNGPGGGALNPTALARWFREYTSAVGSAGVARFITEQSVLYGMNPTVARIFDPSYFLKMLVPGAMGVASTTLDTEAGATMQSVARLRDTELQGRVNINPERPAGDGLSARPDVYGPENRLSDGQEFTVDELVDASLEEGSPYLRTERSSAGGTISRFNASRYFEDRDASGLQQVRATVKADAASGFTNALRSKLAQSNALDGIVRVPVLGEEADGSVLSPTQDPSGVVDDDDARIPLSFTDLRKDPVKNAYRSVYFRPLNLQFSTAIAPEYNDASSFGRVDPIIGYQKTTRTVNVSFEVHAFAPEDLEVMYNKLVWLSSMCYPSYGSDSLIKSGPVVRMRIGDAVSTESGGLPGVIRNLNFDFADALWELRKGMKVPRSFKVSLDYLALHEGPVGLLNGVFGVFQLPPGGTGLTKDTNFAGNTRDSRSDGVPDGASVLPGRFARFGEPRK